MTTEFGEVVEPIEAEAKAEVENEQQTTADTEEAIKEEAVFTESDAEPS